MHTNLLIPSRGQAFMLGAIVISSFAIRAAAQSPGWEVVILPEGSVATSVRDHRVGGYATLWSGSLRPRLWTLVNGVWTVETSTYPTGMSGLDGDLQIGTSGVLWGINGHTFPTGDTFAGTFNAIWSDTIVGQYSSDAARWELQSDDTLIRYDLTPSVSGYLGSSTLATDGAQHGGWYSATTYSPKGNFFACVWNGTSSSPTILHPTGEGNNSFVYGVHDGVQVGSATVDNGEYLHAWVWEGSASGTDLTPTADQAEARGVFESIIVGHSDQFNGYGHATLWRKTVDGYLAHDLHQYLPPTYFGSEVIRSVANAVWTESGKVWVCGSFSLPGGSTYAVLWLQTVDVDCPADLAEPFGVLNFFDVSSFLAAFNASAPEADLFPVGAPDGVWNFFDVSQFLAYYNNGCGTELE